jgi:hypothetical protein
MSMKDKRRADQRGQTLENPFWLTSAEINKDDDDAEAVLFSFPKAGEDYLVLGAVVEVIEAFAGGTVALNIGAGTIATDGVTDGATVTVVDADEYVPTADITNGTIGKYVATSGDMVAALAAGTFLVITGTAATVPVVYAALTSSATITAGRARVHLLVSRIP